MPIVTKLLPVPENLKPRIINELNMDLPRASIYGSLLDLFGISWTDIDEETILKIIHMIDQMAGDKINDFYEGVTASFLSTMYKIAGDKKLTKKDLPALRELMDVINKVIMKLLEGLPDDPVTPVPVL